MLDGGTAKLTERPGLFLNCSLSLSIHFNEFRLVFWKLFVLGSVMLQYCTAVALVDSTHSCFHMTHMYHFDRLLPV